MDWQLCWVVDCKTFPFSILKMGRVSWKTPFRHAKGCDLNEERIDLKTTNFLWLWLSWMLRLKERWRHEIAQSGVLIQDIFFSSGDGGPIKTQRISWFCFRLNGSSNNPMIFFSSGGGGLMKTQTMSLGFQCSSCPFKSSSKKGIKVRIFFSEHQKSYFHLPSRKGRICVFTLTSTIIPPRCTRTESTGRTNRSSEQLHLQSRALWRPLDRPHPTQT